MLCSLSFLSEYYPSVHRINGPNCVGHFKCEEELSGQKELFAGFCFCWENTWSNLLRLITVLCIGEAWRVPPMQLRASSELLLPEIPIGCRETSRWGLSAGVSIVKENPFPFTLNPEWSFWEDGHLWTWPSLLPLLGACQFFASPRWNNYVVSPTYQGLIWTWDKVTPFTSQK